MYEMFTPEELHWLKVIEDDEKLLDDMLDKRDIQITRKFIDFLKLIIKYENLRCGKHLEVHRRLIRVHRNIPTKMLDFKKYEYIIFNGLYIVADVIFLDAEIVKEFYKNPTRDMRERLGLPEEVALSTIKTISTRDNKEIGVGLITSELTKNYIPYPSKWSYPIW